MAATIGLVMEVRRNGVSRRIGTPEARLVSPKTATSSCSPPVSSLLSAGLAAGLAADAGDERHRAGSSARSTRAAIV